MDTMEAIQTLDDAAVSGYFAYDSIKRLYSYCHVHHKCLRKHSQQSVFDITMGVVPWKQDATFRVTCAQGTETLLFMGIANPDPHRTMVVPTYAHTACEACMCDDVKIRCVCGVVNYCSAACFAANEADHEFFCACAQHLPKHEPTVYSRHVTYRH